MKALEEAKDPKFKDYLKAGNHFEVMISMGCNAEMLEDIEKEQFEKDIIAFMDEYDIDLSEYRMVVDFYNKVYHNMRSQQPDGGQIHRRDPGIWSLRKQFLKRCGIKESHKRKSYKYAKVVWFMKDEHDFCWWRFNTENLPDDAMAYLVSNTALAMANRDARSRTLDYMWDEMEDSTLYELYKGVKTFNKIKSES